MSFARARAYFNIYTRAYVYTLLISVRTLLALIDNQLFTRKMMFFSIFSARKFGQSKKKQYLCTRFAPEVGGPLNGKSHTEKRNADNQPLTKKVINLMKKVTQKFGQSKKNQYLCNRFAPEVSEPRNGKNRTEKTQC